MIQDVIRQRIETKRASEAYPNETLHENSPLSISKEVRCKFCNSGDIIKYGHFNSTQRYWCKNCHRKFTDNDALPGMKTPLRLIGYALDLFYQGLSLKAISRYIDQKHNIYFSESTIYKWVEKFSQKGIEDTRNLIPAVGNTWILKESRIKMCGICQTIVDIIDSETHYLLASGCVNEFNIKIIEPVLKKAINKANKLPNNVIILSDSERTSIVDLAYSPDHESIHMIIFDKEQSDIIANQFFGSFIDRNKIVSMLKKNNTVARILNGWIFHYNYHRTQNVLDDKTPALKAGINKFSECVHESTQFDKYC